MNPNQILFQYYNPDTYSGILEDIKGFIDNIEISNFHYETRKMMPMEIERIQADLYFKLNHISNLKIRWFDRWEKKL